MEKDLHRGKKSENSTIQRFTIEYLLLVWISVQVLQRVVIKSRNWLPPGFE